MQGNTSPILGVSDQGLPDRDPALDGLRGFALSMVLIGHVVVFLPHGPLLSLFHFSTNALLISLDLFFVLSGFLITAILIRTRDGRGYFRNFYVRRVLRIFPIYFLLLVAYFFVRPLLPGGPPPWQENLDKETAWFFLYVQNLVMAWRGEGIGWGGLYHSFSLAIEEQFYLLWPFFVWLVPPRRLLHFCLTVCAASLVYKTWMWLNGASWWYLYVHTLTRLHALAAGGALAAWLIIHKGAMPPWLRPAGVIAGVSIPLIIVAAATGLISRIDFAVLLNYAAPVLFAWMLMSLMLSSPQQPLRRLLQQRVMILLGRYSYGLYLIHQPTLYEVRRILLPIWEPVMGVHAAVWLSGLIGMALALPMAVAVYHAFELPILRLKRHFRPERSRQSAQVASMSQAAKP